MMNVFPVAIKYIIIHSFDFLVWEKNNAIKIMYSKTFYIFHINNKYEEKKWAIYTTDYFIIKNVYHGNQYTIYVIELGLSCI
jgi:hypothetical protein